MKTTQNPKTTDKIRYSQKNIFDSAIERIRAKEYGASVIMPHVCNNVNAFGAGFAAAITSQFPIVKQNFHLLGKTATLGKNQNVIVLSDKSYGHKLIVVNMIAQNGLYSTKNRRPLNYAALTFCMNDIRLLRKKILSESDTNRVEIHAPKFGSGLAGGDWRFISDLINDLWADIDTTIYLKGKE